MCMYVCMYWSSTRAGADCCSSNLFFNVLLCSVKLVHLFIRLLLAYCLFEHFAATALVRLRCGLPLCPGRYGWSRRLCTDRLYILTTFKTTRTRSSPTACFSVLLTSWISSWWSMVSTVFITLTVLPVSLDVLLLILGSLGQICSSPMCLPNSHFSSALISLSLVSHLRPYPAWICFISLWILVWGWRTSRARSDRCGYAWNDFVKKSSYNHSCLFRFSFFIFFSCAHLRVASANSCNPVSGWRANRAYCFNYYMFLILLFCFLVISWNKRRAVRPCTETFMHTYTLISVNRKNCAKETIYIK